MTSQKNSTTLCIQITCCTGPVQDKEAAFKNAYKNLKPGGQFAMQCPLIMEAILEALCGKEVAKEFTESIFFSPMTVYEEAAKKVDFLFICKMNKITVQLFQTWNLSWTVGMVQLIGCSNQS